MCRHQLQDERESHEYSATPPACLGEERTSLANAYELIRRALSAEIRGDATTLPALQQNGSDEDNGVEDENCEKQIKNHL